MSIFSEKTTQILKKLIFLVRIIGSYAKGNTNVDSDIDLAVVFENLSDTFDMQVQLMKIRRKFDTRIEPHAFRESDFEPSNPLAKEILTRGIKMLRNIEAVYRDGVLKPLSPLKLKEHERVRITVEEESVVRATSGMFSGLDDNTISEIAFSPEFLPEEA